MIRSISSSLSTFKALTFRAGLNIVVADRKPESTIKETRNRRGKSSLVALIDFFMGAEGFLAGVEQLSEQTFSLVFDAGSRKLAISRSPGTPGKVFIDMKEPPPELSYEIDDESGRRISSLNSWRQFLGHSFFGLPMTRDSVEWKKNAPSYRNLISYFLRREPGGFKYPDTHTDQQQDVQKQLAVSFFLDFDWRISQGFESVRERERTLRQLKLEQKELNPAEIRTDLAILERQYKDQAKLVADFRVVPQFRELEKEASKLARKIRDLSDANTSDRELIEELARALTNEAPPSLDDVERLYAEATIVLSEQVLRRIEEVREFHVSVLRNRRTYLQGEINAAELRIKNRERKKTEHEERRREILSILQSGGALEQHSKLQSELARLDHEVRRLRDLAGKAADYRRREAELKIEREQLKLRLRSELDERTEIIQDAILTYETISSALYGEAGKLTVDDSISGPKLGFPIQGEKSKGINSMRIFCFDMMLVHLLSRRSLGPGFLMHDSHLFDGVDERQVATALAIGAETIEAAGWQYIVTMNSDEVPDQSLYPGGFDIHKYVNPVRLTDDPGGGLFGIEF
jgi:uncharacterized protein YydD (DUF2326 family)